MGKRLEAAVKNIDAAKLYALDGDRDTIAVAEGGGKNRR